MPLPKLDVPTYDLTLPSSNRQITFRPFLVKEEKILLMAMEGENQNEMVNAMKQIIGNCIIEEINVDILPLFDLEFIFLNLRSKSVGAESTVGISCPNCTTTNQFEINLDDIKISKTEEHNKEILLTDSIGLIMKYPTVDVLKGVNISDETVDVENTMLMVESCVETLWEGDATYDMSDYTKNERQEFFDNLTQSQFAEIQSFFETMPKLSHDIQYSCSNCDYNDTMTLEGLQNFFG